MGYSRIISFRPDTKENWENYNPVLSQGEGAFETDTGNYKIGDGTNTYKNLAYSNTPKPDVIDLTNEDYTYNLPPITGLIQRVSVYWKNGGTYTITFATLDGSIIGNGETYKGEGNGHILLESDGTNWQVMSFNDTEDWHIIGATGEQAYQNGWIAEANQMPPKYKFSKGIDNKKIIHFQGNLDGANATDNVVFTLPELYKPLDYIRFWVSISYDATTPYYPTEISILTTGEVRCNPYGTTTDKAKLFGNVFIE